MPFRMGRSFMHDTVQGVLVFVMLWLTLVFATDDKAFINYPGFRLMAELAPEKTWASFTGAIAVFGLVSAFSTSRNIHLFAALLLCFGFLVLTYFVVAGKPYGTGTGPYLGFAFLGAALAYSRAFLRGRAPARVDTLNSQR